MPYLTIALDALSRSAHNWARAVKVFSGEEGEFVRGSLGSTDKLWRADSDGAVASSCGGSK